MRNITLLRLKHTAKLEKLIKQNADYNKILKESRIVDKYIVIEMRNMLNRNQEYTISFFNESTIKYDR